MSREKFTNIETGFEINAIVQTQNNNWLATKWRPAMGWMYMSVCIFDFIIFPILWSLLQSFLDGEVTRQWEPLTLQGAGLFHLAMGAVLGIAAYGRTQEKLKGIDLPFVQEVQSNQYDDDNNYENYEPKNNYKSTTPMRRRSFASNSTKIPNFEGMPEGEE